ncbi:hypothetical protein mRhiFer1_008609 [Rhinolophus ferrumequinum]|uniref:Uncharacterized protein n=1 Tax=Rhinolophus ferrumequinum TaxID=59479 RepID=A0A7J7U0V5_RHIFE|nr:hypothetical protein mRhiFer1_008609 [Rhinolophus ferrumequinum]
MEAGRAGVGRVSPPAPSGSSVSGRLEPFSSMLALPIARDTSLLVLLMNRYSWVSLRSTQHWRPPPPPSSHPTRRLVRGVTAWSRPMQPTPSPSGSHSRLSPASSRLIPQHGCRAPRTHPLTD